MPQEDDWDVLSPPLFIWNLISVSIKRQLSDQIVIFRYSWQPGPGYYNTLHITLKVFISMDYYALCKLANIALELNSNWAD